MFDESHTARACFRLRIWTATWHIHGTCLRVRLSEGIFLMQCVWGIPLPPAQQGEHLRGRALETKPIPEPGVQWRWKQTSAMPQNRRVPNKLVVLFLTSFIRTNITPTMREQQDTAQTRACLSSSASGWEGLGGSEGVEGSVCACVWGWRGAKPLRVTQMYIFPNVVETRYIFSLKSYVEFNVMRIFFTAIIFFSFPHFENAALLYPIRNYLAQYDSNHCVAQTKLQKSVSVFARNCAVSLCLQMPWVWTSDIFYFWVRIYSSSFCIVGKNT